MRAQLTSDLFWVRPHALSLSLFVFVFVYVHTCEFVYVHTCVL